MKVAMLCVILLVMVNVLPASLSAYDVVLREAPRLQFPGVVNVNMDPNTPGDIDCSSPAHWDGGMLYMFYSTGHPFRSSGPDILHLSRPSQRVRFDNEAGWTMGGRWIESTHKSGDGRLMSPNLIADIVIARVKTN